MLVITPFIQIPLTEFEFSFVRSSGPGGQNVNKVNSKAVLRWNLLSSPSLSLDIRARFMGKLANQLTRSGELLVSSDRFRDQGMNREDCLEKLKALLVAAAFIPKARKKSRPSFSSKRKAKEAKSLHSQKKNLRKVSRGDY
ncbi:alternative ribosome rescue aminoacyl-tRNA hydrolase ArfB [Bdellovibrionota bacterium FG-2]